MKPRCICSGILFADIACSPIDHLPAAGELVQTDKIGIYLGGCASNVALDLSRLEVPVILSGCVGDDSLSDFILNAVSVPGVDISRVRRIANSWPGTTMCVNVQGQD
ncbi:MAG: carbohydrate kinase family protein, partial [Thermoguttaceae bacterium]